MSRKRKAEYVQFPSGNALAGLETARRSAEDDAVRCVDGEDGADTGL